LFALILASFVFSLGRLTVYAATEAKLLTYSAGAVAISEIAVIVSLSILGKYILQNSVENFWLVLTVFAIGLTHIVGTILFEAILKSWHLEPIHQSLFQRVVSLAFTLFVYLGLGWGLHALTKNRKEVGLAREILAVLFNNQIELNREIRDARTYAIREVSLEIQSSLGTIESYKAAGVVDHDLEKSLNHLQDLLQKIQGRVNSIAGQFPSPVGRQQGFPKFRYSSGTVFSTGIGPNQIFPGLVAIVSFFGFCSWLSYFLTSLHAAFWGVTLSVISFGIFFGYNKFIASKLVTKALVVRVLVFETLIIFYLFFWLLILGFFAGANYESYGGALAYAVIPFLFFNSGVVMSGFIFSSQEQRAQLTEHAVLLKMELVDLEIVRKNEDKVWKSLFTGDISVSPTTASVILRDATLSNDQNRVVLTLIKVSELWNSLLVTITNVT
jgi:hypothetical protein